MNANGIQKQILIIEDEPTISQFGLRILSKEGYAIDIAPDGEIARAMMEKKQYDLFLMDIRIPKMNGQALWHWMKDNHAELSNRVIFTSGDTIAEDTRQLIEQSGRPILAKPFTPAELKEIVQQNIKK